jgi:trimeric autotransporter adhesin
MKTISLSLLLLLGHIGRAQIWNNVGGGTDIGRNFALYADSILYVGGDFDTVSYLPFIPSRGFASWNGSNWNDLSGTYGNDFTVAICAYNGSIYHAVKNSAVFVGEQALGSRVGHFGEGLYCMAVYNNELYVGGSFKMMKDSDVINPSVIFNGIARWDGTEWNVVGGGLKSKPGNPPMTVYAMYVYDGSLYVGGTFDSAGHIKAKNIAKWNGNVWKRVRGGVLSTNDTSKVEAFTEYQGKLIVGGVFNKAGGITVSNIAQWNGISWSPLDTTTFNNEVLALCVFNEHLYIGGRFSMFSAQNRVVMWNGTSFFPLGPGITSNGGVVLCLTVWNNSLIVGGKFKQVGSLSVSNLASWTEAGLKMEAVSAANFSVYPSVLSASSTLHIQGLGTLDKVNVIDGYGRTCVAKAFSNESDATITLPTDFLPGLYFVQIISDKEISIRRIIVIN